MLAVAATHPTYLLGRRGEAPGLLRGTGALSADETRLAGGAAGDERGRPLRGLQVGPINVVSLVGARAGLEARTWLRETRAMLTATRSRLTKALAQLGLSWLPSETNFLLVDVGRPADTVMAQLNASGVRVGSSMERASTRLRITIGTDEEIDAFIAALRTALA